MRSQQKASKRRRSAAEWTRLVAEFRKSGLSVEDFAASRGVPVGRLRWWRWRLDVAGSSPSAPADKLRLVPVDVDATASVPAITPPSALAWELCTTRGDVLRVYRAVAPVELEAVLSVMLPRGGRR
jgi:hypothetical protein